jgi:hypothetical protein
MTVFLLKHELKPGCKGILFTFPLIVYSDFPVKLRMDIIILFYGQMG